ncbi:mammalian cell entry protein [Mycobacterium colombiense]|uniref:Mammalian cell entry protein n=1 Tax=Mycobacterium colombiense TaxID=339268 RepID=A0A1A2RLX2_9MYCO|nr:mammalian cell entry protein [Mycobacterium colombiense]
MRFLRHPTTWGAAALVIATTISLVVAWIYVSPPGQKTVTFYSDDAASIRAGDQVRIAGVGVGKVKDLVLEQDRVRVTARVDGDAFVGDQSQIEIRMLTVVGGFYVNIVSLGDTPLGTKPIPLERVRMPYNLMQALADTTKLTENVNGESLRKTLDQLQNGFAGDNIKSLSAIVDAGNSLMSTIQEQRGQLTEIVKFTNEYVQAFNGFEDQLRAIARKASIAEQTLVLYGHNFGEGISTFNKVLTATAPLSYFYMKHRDEFLEKVRAWLERARMWSEQSGAVVRGVRELRNKIERVLDAQNAPPELLATDMCIPIPGSAC